MTEKRCSKCGRSLSLDNFNNNKNRKDGLDPWCKDCHKKRYHNNREYYLKYAEDYRKSEKGKKNIKEHYERTKHIKAQKTKKRRQSLRLKCLELISGNNVFCKKCGINDVRILVIDHVKNNGSPERKKMRDIMYYNKILNMDVSDIKDEYQILCRNCNWIKRLDDKRWMV